MNHQVAVAAAVKIVAEKNFQTFVAVVLVAGID